MIHIVDYTGILPRTNWSSYCSPSRSGAHWMISNDCLGLPGHTGSHIELIGASSVKRSLSAYWSSLDSLRLSVALNRLKRAQIWVFVSSDHQELFRTHYSFRAFCSLNSGLKQHKCRIIMFVELTRAQQWLTDRSQNTEGYHELTGSDTGTFCSSLMVLTEQVE